eukprot:5128963-Prymnesium_polylepis.1
MGRHCIERLLCLSPPPSPPDVEPPESVDTRDIRLRIDPSNGLVLYMRSVGPFPGFVFALKTDIAEMIQ